MEEILRTNSCRELDWQISFARIAMKDLREALTEMDQAARDFRSQREWFDVGSWTTLHGEFDRRRSAATRRFWYSAQGFLLAVTRISSTLWPAEDGSGAGRNLSPSSGIDLRKHLGLPDRSPLMDRAVRNHLERFDEGPDPWAEYHRGNSENGNGNGDRGPAARVFDSRNRLRYYDPAGEALSFEGERISLRELEDAVGDLARKLEAALRAAAPETQTLLGRPRKAGFARM